jgi:hypothetical protein
VGLRCVQKVSSADHDYVANGFLARSAENELRCPGQEVSVLEAVQDVTRIVESAVRAPEASPAASQQRKTAFAALEKECSESGAQCEVVTLYAGARYHLYRYKRYTDVRLVFAPEYEIGFFGGDADNFTYPRYCLDVVFLRAYENGKPASTPHYLAWSRTGAKEGELVFVVGHPASSSRLATASELEFRRDHLYPYSLERLRSRIAALKSYMKGSAENARAGRTVAFSAENIQKRLTGFLGGLRDPRIMGAKAAEEKKLKSAVDKHAGLASKYGLVWDDAAAALKEYLPIHKRYALLETGAATGSELFSSARTIVRMIEETTKPDSKRMREYSDAALPSIESRLYANTAVTASLEIAVLAEYFDALGRDLGANDPVVKSVLAGKAPLEAARVYVETSKLGDVDVRKRVASSPQALSASEDGMIRLARLLDGEARAVRGRYEERVEAVLTASKSKIALARFDIYGTGEYPDATGTLRLSYASVKGYTGADGAQVAPWTTLGGIYRRATGQEPYRLPKRWLDARTAIDPKTPFNFVATADTHGGNSGSPTVNRKGELVGLLFDSNLEKLPNEFVFSEDGARSVHVSSQGIIEALRKVYKADTLVAEVLGSER